MVMVVAMVQQTHAQDVRRKEMGVSNAGIEPRQDGEQLNL
jgi:hypothetical protein